MIFKKSIISKNFQKTFFAQQKVFYKIEILTKIQKKFSVIKLQNFFPKPNFFHKNFEFF